MNILHFLDDCLASKEYLISSSKAPPIANDHSLYSCSLQENNVTVIHSDNNEITTVRVFSNTILPLDFFDLCLEKSKEILCIIILRIKSFARRTIIQI